MVLPPQISSTPLALPGSAIGLGLGRLQIRLEGTRDRVTDREVETVAGTVTGGTPARLLLYVNDAPREVTTDGAGFAVAVPLIPGRNRLRAVVQDWKGTETEDSLTIEYTPPPPSPRIAIKAPLDGHTLSRDDPPFVVVEGRVDDPAVSTVWLFANHLRVSVRTRQGSFRHVLPVTESVVRLWAETAAGAGSPERSALVTVRAATPSAPLGAILIDWPQGSRDVQAEVRATWRANPARLDVPAVTTTLATFGEASEGAPPGVFYLRNLKGGVYTFWLHYRAGAGTTDVKPTLLVADSGAPTVRGLRLVPVNGAGRAVLARILLPQGILWEQDDWFTGQSQSADTVTKFRLPDGVAWTERKTDLR